jgi:hypothetical protein
MRPRLRKNYYTTERGADGVMSKKRQGRKNKCSFIECKNLQDNFAGCLLCEEHSQNCSCQYHSRKKARKDKNMKKLLKKAFKERELAHDNTKLFSLPRHQYSNEDELEGEDGGMDDFSLQNTLSLEEQQYLDLLETPQRCTETGSECIVFPDFAQSTDTGRIVISSKSFIHCYHIKRQFGPQNQEYSIFLPDCDCDETERLGLIVTGGFDTKEHNLDQLRAEFQLESYCMHSR